MSQKLENAKNLYLEGIKDGNMDVVEQYSGDRYTQHSTGVADGAQGFKDFFKGFLERTKDRDIRVVRTIEDGSFVFVHVYQDIDNGAAKWITTDMFDTDENDKLVEHWDVIAAYQEPEKNVGGTDQVLGDFEIKDLDKTQENKALVRSFITEVFQNGKHDKIADYISTEEYINRNPNVPNGIDTVKQFLTTQDFNYDFIFKVLGQGNHVVTYSKATFNGTELAVFDIFRIEDGKIVEHWDNMEPIPPRSEWANTGKF
ncbi:nuclear transport factor 2 family protein [Polaribacter ponticola]|uniref:Nuclear transport factor 2 family protein n=1 Tax=Polaribacter ponticola TaxID=2978475 RepID=A0ABT5S7F9_9FLAO|nr:nuclear transport factor 2 family protein [Polaribacter sp. MSW5]MDD7914037.1 nuclear transport factor 2 family protein [Polaribacter sp. MSW5]